ncbi:MAG: hypothetical protein MZV64_45305 [Ignavibacteriales bacterium]|nr:hypothetical protein [Ignavibacteriales bacterium]
MQFIPDMASFLKMHEFIKDLEKNKITFIGPSSKSVALMGSKTEASNIDGKE